MSQGIDWSLAKIDWSLPVQAMIAKGNQNAQITSSGQQAVASMGNAQVASQTTMRGQDLDNQQAQANNQLAYAKLGQDQDQFNQTLDFHKDTQQQDSTIKLMGLQVQADMAAAVLGAKDKQTAWKQYTDSVTKLGQDPAKIGLPVTYNKDAHEFLSSQLGSAVDGINAHTQSNGMTTGTANTGTPQGKVNAKASQEVLKKDLEWINEGRKTVAPMEGARAKLENLKVAVDDFEKYSLTGLGTGGHLGRLAAEAGSRFSPDQAKAATAGKIIDDTGKAFAYMKRKDMFGSGQFSDPDRDALESISFTTSTPKDSLLANANLAVGFMTRAQEQQSFNEAYLSQNGVSQGADVAWRQFNNDHPVVDPKTRQINPSADWREYLGRQSSNNQAQLNQPSNMYGDASNKNPYM